jgi:hypothetical protein
VASCLVGVFSFMYSMTKCGPCPPVVRRPRSWGRGDRDHLFGGLVELARVMQKLGPLPFMVVALPFSYCIFLQ